MQAANLSSKKSRFQLLLSVALIILAVWIFFNRQTALDTVALYRYSPSPEIVQLAQNTTMSDTAKRYFFASHPEVNNATDFNQNCKAEAEQTIILGCYTLRRIYLFNVTDPRLSGVKEVTAAHEMLHAAYDRLDSGTKDRLNQQIVEQTQQIQDARIKGLIELYNKNEPGQLVNEMHSILGTEVAQLSPELETYYKRYFSDRQKTVRYSQQYEGVFTGLNQRRDQITAQLNSLNETIKQRSDMLNNSISDLNNEINLFNQRARNGGFDSEAQFKSERQKLLNQQAALNKERDSINGLIARFNELKQELIALNGEAESLNQSLDSTPEEVPSL